LENGQAPWLTKKGLVVRGYRSKTDHSVQPYGLVVPETWTSGAAAKHRLDFWFHGRGETLSEVNLSMAVSVRQGNTRQRTRLCCILTVAIQTPTSLRAKWICSRRWRTLGNSYPIDDDRIAVRGFSMGGAACWQFAVHYPDLWFAANPGASTQGTLVLSR
jgi:predicted peptidase|tara:strand:- start:6298 stop:6777 length:480 start_codon:yes stop_codon:yes gene_type:complete